MGRPLDCSSVGIMNFCAECTEFQGLQVRIRLLCAYERVHSCLWCHIASDQLRTPLITRGYSPSRTLETLKRDYDRFSQSGGNIKHAKNYNNVIQPYMWENRYNYHTFCRIRVGIYFCLPALHVSLYPLYTLLEQASHKLDMKLAQEKNCSGQLGGVTFMEYSFKLETLHELTEERDGHVQAVGVLEQLVTRMALTATSEDSAQAQIRYVKDTIHSYQQKTHELI